MMISLFVLWLTAWSPGSLLLVFLVFLHADVSVLKRSVLVCGGVFKGLEEENKDE